jgi:hypothetical protein
MWILLQMKLKKKSFEGKLIAQSEAALVRESELYEQMELAEKKKQKEKELVEKINKKTHKKIM